MGKIKQEEREKDQSWGWWQWELGELKEMYRIKRRDKNEGKQAGKERENKEGEGRK